jgi:transforming growth factor-beta-induced protein
VKWIAIVSLLTVLGLATGASAAASEAQMTSQSTRVEQAATANIVDTAVAAGNFKTLVAAVQAAGLADTLKGPGPFTVFAPTDAAFAALPGGSLDALLKDPARLREVLLYHVVAGTVASADVVKLTQAKTVGGADVTVSVSGSTVKINDAVVTAVDIKATNGVIHVIDKVLVPAATAPVATTPVPLVSIVDTAVAAGTFKTLVAAVQAAGLADTLQGPGPLTVFAPTDAAFAALPAGALDALLKDPARLREVLLYHVVSGAVTSADVVKLTQAKPVGAGTLAISASGSTVRVNDAAITAVDVRASNGVIHVIDKVLIPATAASAAAPKTGNAGSLTNTTQTWLLVVLAAAALSMPLAARFAARRATR